MTIVLEISLPIRMVGNGFGVVISGLTTSQYSYQDSQSSQNYSRVTIVIEYQADLQGRTLSLSYTSARRLQEIHGRMLGTVSSGNFRTGTHKDI